MKQISKAEFIRRITSGKSFFLGVSSVCTPDVIKFVRKEKREKDISLARNCKYKGNYYLVFDDNSHLYLTDAKPFTEIKCYETPDNILIVEQKYTSQCYGFEDEVSYKYLYYTMV